MNIHYRQGDLLFIKADSLGDSLREKHGQDIITSNITGHSHSITRGKIYLANPTWSDRANFYVIIPDEGAEVVHQEHRSIPLSGGIYKVIRQREVNGYVRD